ncbi:unnamed protein product, partial [Mesorhabditis belari]|uniref:Uncharacterized protein n=1 Tax=Mesorhabditis belari TaxID=2138241 RepID=A0AAF3FP53_9BILA
MGGAVIGALPPITMSILSIGSLVTMITMVSMCTTCCKKVKNSDPDEVAYGVIVVSEDVPKTVQFRNGSHKNAGERFSQPVTKSSSNSAVPSRTSAPPAGQRALPELPDSTYSAINKNRSEKEIEYADGPATQLYESIDRDNDSTIDPLYSKVTENRSTRRYDYPVFMKNTRAKETDDPFYQSVSQIYAPGSEDPYSSIASEPRVALAQQEDDSSSAYDPGYAKVKPSTKAEREKTEAELDQLYSKIRRNERRDAVSPLPGTSHQIDLIQTNGEVLREDLGRAASGQEGDDTSGREPSYRYITVRESAEVIRERLRQQGQLGPGGLPIREHYYSTIGNEYETVDGTSTTYSRVREQQPSSTSSRHSQLTPPSALSISVNPAGEYAPAPPTSPIPERTPELFDRLHQGSSRTPEDSTGLMYSVIRKTPTGPSPTIPTVVKPPSRSRPNSESHESVWPSVVVSANRSSNQSINQQHRQTKQGEYCDEIQSFMNRPVLPYGSEALVNKRVTEERETVTEERRSRGPMPDPPISKSESRLIILYFLLEISSAIAILRQTLPIVSVPQVSTRIRDYTCPLNQKSIKSIINEFLMSKSNGSEERHQPLLNEHIVQIKAIQEQRPATLQIEQKSTPGPSSPLGNAASGEI